MPAYALTSKIHRTETDVLAIHCGDYRFQTAFQEFLNRSLNLDGNYDLMVIPGGPLSLTLFEYLPKFNWASWKWVRFFRRPAQNPSPDSGSASGLRLAINAEYMRLNPAEHLDSLAWSWIEQRKLNFMRRSMPTEFAALDPATVIDSEKHYLKVKKRFSLPNNKGLRQS